MESLKAGRRAAAMSIIAEPGSKGRPLLPDVLSAVGAGVDDSLDPAGGERANVEGERHLSTHVRLDLFHEGQGLQLALEGGGKVAAGVSLRPIVYAPDGFARSFLGEEFADLGGTVIRVAVGGVREDLLQARALEVNGIAHGL